MIADLAIILFAAKLGDELFKRLGQPALIGEILAGLLIGPSVLGIVTPGETIEVFAELGVVFLLFWVGLETKLSEMREVGATAGVVGVAGVVVPFAAGTAAGLVFGESTATSLFIGSALAATSVGITSAVFAELGILATRAARTVLGAAVIDDILALLLVAVADRRRRRRGRSTSPRSSSPPVLAIGFVALFALGGTAVMRRAPQLLHAPRFSESPLLPAVILCLGIAALAANIGLAAVIGAFLAGMIVAETKEQHPIEDEIAPLYAFFTPFFFASIGLELELDVLVEGPTLLLVAGLSALAVVTKLLGAWPGARRLGRRDAAIVALGMVPRGEVGIIVAGIGAMSGVVDERLFAAIVGMSIVTTLIVPPFLRRLSDQDAGRPDRDWRSRTGRPRRGAGAGRNRGCSPAAGRQAGDRPREVQRPPGSGCSDQPLPPPLTRFRVSSQRIRLVSLYSGIGMSLSSLPWPIVISLPIRLSNTSSAGSSRDHREAEPIALHQVRELPAAAVAERVLRVAEVEPHRLLADRGVVLGADQPAGDRLGPAVDRRRGPPPPLSPQDSGGGLIAGL